MRNRLDRRDFRLLDKCERSQAVAPGLTHEVNYCLSLMMYYAASNGKCVFNACFPRLHG